MESWILENFYSGTILILFIVMGIQIYLQRKAILLLCDDIDDLKEKTQHIEGFNPELSELEAWDMLGDDKDS